MENNKNKNISNSYKDYKYVYTGLDDYLKDHHLDKKEIKEEKEKIVHDHRNVFDFNNPNQHQHDYSFDFNQEPEQPKPKTQYKDRYGNVYNTKPTYQQTTTPVYTQPKYNYNQNSKELKKAKNIILIIFFAPFIIAFLFELISFFTFLDDAANYETDILEEETYNTYQEPVIALCEGIEENNYNKIYPYLITGDIYNDWRTLIFNLDANGNAHYSEERICTIKNTYHPTSNELVNIETRYQNRYSTDEFIEDGYMFEISVQNKNYEIKNYIIITIKLNDKWYLFEIK